VNVEVLLILKLGIQRIRGLLDGIGIVFELELMDHLLQNVKLHIDLNHEDATTLLCGDNKNMVIMFE
jgi:hypothetical protein